ncbi:MAG: SAM hydroxide adenosyltransferase, partial [Bacteroidota bacterium]
TKCQYTIVVVHTVKGKKFTIEFSGEEINEISQRYNELTGGNILALFNSAGYLEIAQAQDSVSKLYNLAVGSSVVVRVEI